ncbi:OB-fold protein [Schauerella aestuarii]|uniref:OB-fold protein n=1 Tax=Schauerella aestuarii TaxID=2511204 RepID=UPI00136868AC|nr:hypothetical protein [Achromobacter aestuarii]MYZ44233.1 hypothetical protein [Achromobacter aestuarii]
MCGRIAQSRAVADYLETIAWNSYSLPDTLGPRYNAPPGTKPLAFNCMDRDPEATQRFCANYRKKPVKELSVVIAFCSILSPSLSSAYQPSHEETQIMEFLQKDERDSFISGTQSYFSQEMGLVLADAAGVAKVYRENQVAGDQKYFGKRVLLTGTIASINSGIGNEPYIVFEGPIYGGTQARLPKDKIERIASLRKKQRASVVCEGSGAVVGTPTFKNCQFSDDVVDRKWQEFNVDLQRFYSGDNAVSDDVAFLALRVAMYAAFIDKKHGCPSNEKSCKAALLKASKSKGFMDSAKTISAQFKSEGLKVPNVEKPS